MLNVIKSLIFIMEISNFNIELGLPTNRKIGYGTTKKEVRFENESVLVMEAFEIPTVSEGGKIPKVARKFSMSNLLAKQLGYLGKDFEKTEEVQNELIYFGHAVNENGGKVLFLINSTNTDNEVVATQSCRVTQNFTFSNKNLYDALAEQYGIEEGSEKLFNAKVMDSSLTGGMPVVMLEPRLEETQDFADNTKDEEQAYHEVDPDYEVAETQDLDPDYKVAESEEV